MKSREPGVFATYHVHTAAEVAAWEPPDYLIDDFIAEESLVTLFGAPGSGKSFVALDIAASIAIGQDWASRSVNDGFVVYVLAEGAAAFSKRITAWCNYHDMMPKRLIKLLFYGEPLDLSQRGDVDNLIYWVTRFNPKLIVIDTLARSIGMSDENSAKDMNLVIAGVARMQARLGTAVMALHHTPKGNEKTERGSGSLRGAVDTSISVSLVGDVITLTCVKQ